MLEDARLAPSWKNGQGWRLLVLTDREKILRAGAILGRNPGCDYATLPVLMFLLMDPRCSGQMDGKDYALVDAGIFIDHLTLSAAAHGLGSCVLGWLKHEELKKALAFLKPSIWWPCCPWDIRLNPRNPARADHYPKPCVLTNGACSGQGRIAASGPDAGL